MKIKESFMAVVALLLMSAFTMPNNSNVELEMKDGNIYVSTNLKGEAGFKACGTSERQKVDAYVFTLFRKEYSQKRGSNRSKGGDTQTCSAPRARWVQVGQQAGNSSEDIFENMPIGEYKVTVFAGQPIGCDIDGDTQGFPSKSIVYEQVKTGSYALGTSNNTNSNNVYTTSKNDGMTVFPNPTSGELHVQVKNSELKNTANIIIYDMTGRVVMERTQNVEDSSIQEWKLNVASFSNGAYLLRVFDKSGNDYQEKILVNSNQ